MIVQRPRASWRGKVVDHVECSQDWGDALVMCQSVSLHFTDGSTLHLALDWRGDACYISEQTVPAPSKAMPPPLDEEGAALWGVLQQGPQEESASRD